MMLFIEDTIAAWWYARQASRMFRNAHKLNGMHHDAAAKEATELALWYIERSMRARKRRDGFYLARK